MNIKVAYNEIEPYCCAWLSNLMDAGHIRPGKIIDKSIVDLSPEDVRGYDLVHFFAGIAVWDHALTLAGWRFDGRVTWTGSCPCQPFSAAGKGEGYADERHLWPHWYRLIGECRPATIFGEQVDAAIRTGWLDDVSLSLESLGYAFGAVDFPSCSVGAPHIRQRLYFVADLLGSGHEGLQRGINSDLREGWLSRRSQSGSERSELPSSSVGDTECHGRKDGGESVVCGARRWQEGDATERSGHSFWSNAHWLPCIDGKARPVEPGTFPLAHGAAARVGRLRAYGNAICAPQAAEFIRAYMT